MDELRLYADFLEQAALILGRPKLKRAGEQFRMSSEAWRELSEALLPDDVPLLKETKELLLLRRDLFLKPGNHALCDIVAANRKLRQFRVHAAHDFPMGDQEVTAMRERLAEHVMRISDIEH